MQVSEPASAMAMRNGSDRIGSCSFAHAQCVFQMENFSS